MGRNSPDNISTNFFMTEFSYKSTAARRFFVPVLACISLFAILSLNSCVTYKNQILFQGLSDTSYVASTSQPDPIIQRGDQLSIMVFTPDPIASAYYNMPMGGGAGNMQNAMGGNGTIMGYLVDENGNIIFPKLGTINVLGMTQQSLQNKIQASIEPVVKDALVNVRLLNFRVTFINSNRAQTITIMNNKTNMLQFLGSVGGVEWMDKRDGIILIRQVDSVRTVYRLNLADKSIFQSPAYYLQPNDVVYVEPNKRKFLESNAQLLSLFASVTSAISIIIVLANSVF